MFNNYELRKTADSISAATEENFTHMFLELMPEDQALAYAMMATIRNALVEESKHASVLRTGEPGEYSIPVFDTPAAA